LRAKDHSLKERAITLTSRKREWITKMDLKDSTSIRNYELIKQIYKMASDYPYPIAIKKLIEEQRPELKKEK